MNSQLSINDLLLMDSEIAIKWSDTTESYILLQALRDHCPCAHCSGETDVFGNVYKGAHVKKIGTAYELKNVIKVGHYAIRITWGDGHSDGIFTHEYLRNLDLSSE